MPRRSRNEPGFDPARRNRNIGTAKQGHGQGNRLVVPQVDGRSALERIGAHTRHDRVVQGMQVTFLVEHLARHCVHPCSIADVARLLELAPAADWVGIGTIWLRQPTRKQRIVSAVWGRLLYHGEIAAAQRQVVSAGPMIVLEAIERDRSLEWSSALGPDDQDELARLAQDGHAITRRGRRHVIAIDPRSARNTQLYRTLPHEIGHWFDWLEKVEQPAARGEDFTALIDRYFARPSRERESFAHRYAEGMHRQLAERGAIPFDPL